jgi:Recombinase
MPKPEPKFDRVREVLRHPIDTAHLEQRTAAGWRMVAIEWERPLEGFVRPSGQLETEVPYGLQVAADCLHLEENAVEKECIVMILELIVQDLPFSKIATELNDRNYRTRSGAKWDPISVFDLLPRMIEVGPRIFTSEQWAERRQQLFKVFA